MPIYEYDCHECHNQFELLVTGSTTLSCPTCKATAIQRRWASTEKSDTGRKGRAVFPQRQEMRVREMLEKGGTRRGPLAAEFRALGRLATSVVNSALIWGLSGGAFASVYSLWKGYGVLGNYQWILITAGVFAALGALQSFFTDGTSAME